MSSRRRLVLFAGVCLACMAAAIGYAILSVSRARSLVSSRELTPAALVPARPVDSEREAPAMPAPVADRSATAEPAIDSGESPPPMPERGAPMVPVMLRHAELDRSFGAVAIEETGGESERQAGPLQCNRVAFGHTRGVCLTVDRSYATNSLLVFDARFDVVHRLPLAGLPSRARISPNGQFAATTVFVYGHSYGDGDFSTETSILDLASGSRIVPNLQDFEVSNAGARFYAIDFNLWGVTFAADSNRFYATLRTSGRTYLVEGSVSSKRLRVVRENVECPSLSPDNTRLVFKKRVSNDPASLWRLHALDLRTMAETPLSEARSIDDQVEWLDDDRVLYGVPRPDAPAGIIDVWIARADGSGTPAIFVKGAASPTVLRGE